MCVCVCVGCQVGEVGVVGDTPESRTRDLDEKARGKLAGKFLSDAILHADDLKIQTKLDKKGKFGRALGVIVADGVDLNQAIQS